MAQGEARYIKDAFEVFDASVARVLSQGLYGEPPVRIVVAPRNNFFSFPRYFQSNFYSITQRKDLFAKYDPDGNQIYLDIDSLPTRSPETIAREKELELYISQDTASAYFFYRRHIARDIVPGQAYRHEYAHAMDDFGAYRICIAKSGPHECGMASDDTDRLPYNAAWAKRSGALIPAAYFGVESAEDPSEWFAAVTVCEYDWYNKRRCESSDSSMAAYAASVERFIGSFSNMKRGSWRASWIPF